MCAHIEHTHNYITYYSVYLEPQVCTIHDAYQKKKISKFTSEKSLLPGYISLSRKHAASQTY